MAIEIKSVTGRVLKTVEADTLAGAYLSGADLRGADLRGADLTEAYLTEAKGLPEISPVSDFRALLLSHVEASGNSLDMRNWHTCETTHCLAGWITTLHPEGKSLEGRYETGAAASLILHACGEAIPDFYDTSDGAEERAMNWLRTGKQTDSEKEGEE